MAMPKLELPTHEVQDTPSQHGESSAGSK
jgi:hypothetical protein